MNELLAKKEKLEKLLTNPQVDDTMKAKARKAIAEIEEQLKPTKKKGKTKFKTEAQKQEILRKMEERRNRNVRSSAPAETAYSYDDYTYPKPYEYSDGDYTYPRPQKQKRIRTKAQTEKPKPKAEKPKAEKPVKATKSAKKQSGSKAKKSTRRAKIKGFGSPVENRILWDYYGMGNVVVPFDRVNRFMNRMVEAEKQGRIRKDSTLRPLLEQVFTSVKNANNRAITTKKNTVNVVAPKNLMENIEELIYMAEGGLKGLFGLMGLPYDDEQGLGNVEVGIQNERGVVSATNLDTGEITKIGLSPYWQKVFGKPSAGFTAMVYGAPGTGKTTMLLKFAKHLATFGKVAYISSEQAKYENGRVVIADTLKETITRVGANVPNLDFGALIPQDLSKYDVLIIDSVQASGITPDEILALQRANEGLSIIAVSQVLKDGKYKGDTKLEHNSDIVIRLDTFGEAYNTKNRYASMAGLGNISFM